MRKLLLASVIFAYALSMPKPAHASFVCNDYGSCKICDFYSKDGQWQGSISNCQ
jgi:hypothetical protein